MTDKERVQLYKLTIDQLTIATWYEKEFREKLGNRGYQKFIDDRLDLMLHLRKLKNEKNEK